MFYFDVSSTTEITEFTLFNELGFAYPSAINNAGIMVGKAANAENDLFTSFIYDTNDGTSIDMDNEDLYNEGLTLMGDLSEDNRSFVFDKLDIE